MPTIISRERIRFSENNISRPEALGVFSLQFCVTNDKVVPREKMKELTLGNIVKARITRRRG